jgi:mobilization protein
LQRGVRGSEARHITTAQYYRDLKRRTGELEANVQQLQTEQRQAEQQLDDVRKEIKSEKLEAAKTEAKAALVAKVGSLLGGNKLKTEREKLQQRISALESHNGELVRYIEIMEREHKEERTKFNEYMDKIQRYFPYVEKLLPLIDFCRNTLKFSERVIQELCKLKQVRLKGDFYSPEFNRKFRDENAAFSFEEDKNRKGHYHICVNDIPLVQWFRQKAYGWRNGLGIASTKQGKELKI